MRLCLFGLAILLMVIGHVLKTCRWAQFVEVYETLSKRSLLKILSVSHTVNVLFPLRIGDICRVYLSSKKMKNGFAFALATVIVDLYLDLVVVGAIFFGFSLSGKGSSEIQEIAHWYGILLILLIVFTVSATVFRKKLKRTIQKVAAIFNEEIELELLFLSYTVIASFKDIVRKLSKIKLLLYTLGMWSMYLGAYFCFAESISYYGLKYDTSDVFSFIFSKNCMAVLCQQKLLHLNKWNPQFIVLLMIFMVFPLVVIWSASSLYGRLNRTEGIRTSRSLNILPHLNGNDRLAFLETYFTQNDIGNLDRYLYINSDVNVLNDLSAGSNATTILCMDNKNKTFYRKYTFGKDAYKLKKQVEWIQMHEKQIPLAEIIGVTEGEDYLIYDMEYNVNAVGFFSYIHSMPKEQSWKLLRSVIYKLHENLHILNKTAMSESAVREYVADKVFGNLEVIYDGGKYIKQLQEYDEIIINGAAYPNLKYYAEKLSEEKLCSIFGADPIADIHGDLTVENIVCKVGTSEFYIIDPNTENKHNSPFLDYAKLLQSLHGGYEFLMAIKKVEINGNEIRFLYTKSEAYSYLFMKYDALLHELFSEKEVRSIYYHEIIHWFRLMPYKIRKNEKTAVIFYAGLIMVLDDVIKRFGDEKDE